MKNFLKLILVACLSMQLLPHALANQYTFLLTSLENQGDTNQMRGVSNSLKTLTNPEEKYIVEEIPYTQIDKIISLVNALQPTDKVTIISSGVYGIEALTSLKNVLYNKIFTVHLSHQLLKEHKKLFKNSTNLNGVDLVVLPSHTLNRQLKKDLKGSSTELLIVTGVAHNLQLVDLKKEYEQYKSTIPMASKYCLVMLAGDAQEPSGKEWLLYNPKEAEKLAMFITKWAKEKNQYVIVLNGPRTGKHDYNTRQIDLRAHQDGYIDQASMAFISYVKKHYPNVSFFDFQSGKPNMYKAALWATINTPESDIFLPGESTSMVSEVIDISQGKITPWVYLHHAMNKTHLNHILAEYKDGRINILKSDLHTKKLRKPNPVASTSTAMSVAQKIVELQRLR